MGRVSERIKSVAPSATLEISERVASLRAAGTHVHDLGIGEADYPAPPPAATALAEIARQGISRYTEVQGTVPLREAVSRVVNTVLAWGVDSIDRITEPPEAAATRDGRFYGPDEVVVGVGSKVLQYNSIVATCNPGDEVILLGPYWVSYPDMVRMAGATPVMVSASAEEGFVPPIERIAAAITPRTRLILLNSPNNPTGRVWTREQVEALCALVLSHDDLLLLSDEIYSQIVYGDVTHRSPAVHSAHMRSRLILTSGVSKAYSMGGWRIGYACIKDSDVRSAILRVTANTVSCAPSMIQEACIPALDAWGRVEDMRVDFQERARLMHHRLNAMGLPTLEPQGAFYAFADVSSLLGSATSSRVLSSANDVALAFLEDARVACVAGEAFGDDSHVRFSFVRTLEELDAACDALEAFVLRCRETRRTVPV